jgi:hypothetical protein
MRRRSSQGIRLAIALVVALAACQRREPLTAQKAAEIIRAYQFAKEPIYAEVPQRVWWSAKAPQDDYDVKALQTLRNLEHAGLVTVAEVHDGDATAYTAKVTPKGFPVIGTAPSARGPCFRATICYKKYDGLRNFERHPTDPTVGHAELVWHYENPTPFYPLFETKINKPLNKPFASYISFYYKDFDLIL